MWKINVSVYTFKLFELWTLKSQYSPCQCQVGLKNGDETSELPFPSKFPGSLMPRQPIPVSESIEHKPMTTHGIRINPVNIVFFWGGRQMEENPPKKNTIFRTFLIQPEFSCWPLKIHPTHRTKKNGRKAPTLQVVLLGPRWVETTS